MIESLKTKSLQARKDVLTDFDERDASVTC